MESTLSSSCSRSDLPLSRHGAALAHLDSLPLMIRYFGQTALFLLLLTRAAPAFLPTALSVALRPLFPFQQAQYAQVFLLRSASFYMLFAGLGCTNISATSHLFSSYLTYVMSSLSYFLLDLAFYLKLSGRSDRNSFLSLPVLSGDNGSPDTYFSRGTTRIISWPEEERYLRSLQSLVVSFLLSLVSPVLFSWTGGVLSHRNSSRVPSVSTG